MLLLSAVIPNVGDHQTSLPPPLIFVPSVGLTIALGTSEDEKMEDTAFFEG